MLMTGIPESFDEYRRKKIIEKTIQEPEEKQKDIEGLMKSIQADNQFNDFKELGINLNKDMAKIDAKIIPVPTLLLGYKEGQ